MILFTQITAILIALVFFFAGFMKLVKSYEPLDEIQKWSNEKSIRLIRLIAVSEILGALLFFFPYQLNIFPFLSTIAAFGLTALIIGAPFSHLKLGEHREAALTTLLLILIMVVTFMRVFKL